MRMVIMDYLRTCLAEFSDYHAVQLGCEEWIWGGSHHCLTHTRQHLPVLQWLAQDMQHHTDVNALLS